MKIENQNHGNYVYTETQENEYQIIQNIPKISPRIQKIQNIICFSHLRWNFVFQRPQHLLSRWAREANVFYFEEPVFGDFESNYLKSVTSNENVTVLIPHMKRTSSIEEVNKYLEQTVLQFIRWNKIKDYLLWYITPMALPFSKSLKPKMVVYDCMDELSHFKGAHSDMANNEASLMSMTDVVFTGGHHLYEYKKSKHQNIHPFPSSVDQKHFESGMGSQDPSDQASIPHPRAGFFGVIDERLDIDLLDGLASEMPEVHFIMIGPVVKINPDTLPNHKNIHYLGQKKYQELPAYLGNWDVAILPFAKNDSTRFISPTKTPEYLCAHKPVVSTSIRDVAVPYGQLGLVHIADTVDEFAAALNQALLQKDDKNWVRKVTEVLKLNSWDLTWSRMRQIIYETLEKKEIINQEIEKLSMNSMSSEINGSSSTANSIPAENISE